MDDSEQDRARAYHTALRLDHSPVAMNNTALRNGRRWTLLQSIAWIATGSMPFVELVKSWTPHGNTLVPPNASRSAALELEKQLGVLLEPAMSFATAQMHLLKMLSDGDVMIYVDHVEYVPFGIRFNGLTYNADFTGLQPAPDDRYWGYVVVEVESLRRAWAALKPSVITPAYPAINPAEEPVVALAPTITTAAIIEVIDKCVNGHLGVEPTRRAINDAFPDNRLTRARVRDLHADRWKLAYKKDPNPGANPRG